MSPHDFTHRGLLDSLHLWLHRSGGDEALALACRLFDWSTLPSLILSPPERAACADFHEECPDCLTVGRRAEAIDRKP